MCINKVCYNILWPFVSFVYISVPTSGLVEDAQISIENDQYGQD